MKLSDEKIDTIKKKVFITPLDKGFNINNFNCGIEEYNNFLMNDSFAYDISSVTKTHLLISKLNADVIGYISLSTDLLRLSNEEKVSHNINKIVFNGIPSIKLGKLAVDVNYKGNHYGDFLVEIAKGFAMDINDMGIACRFLTVDADIRYGNIPLRLYSDNGFILNEKLNKNRTESLSMRYDLMADEMDEIQDEVAQE